MFSKMALSAKNKTIELHYYDRVQITFIPVIYCYILLIYLLLWNSILSLTYLTLFPSVATNYWNCSNFKENNFHLYYLYLYKCYRLMGRVIVIAHIWYKLYKFDNIVNNLLKHLINMISIWLMMTHRIFSWNFFFILKAYCFTIKYVITFRNNSIQ